jgi:aspartyl-tRNA(Asn)/glutamyl-tRNA(Gln) amidotransferase subunit C
MQQAGACLFWIHHSAFAAEIPVSVLRLEGWSAFAYKPVTMGERIITTETVEKVARLARLAIDHRHAEKYAGQLESILGYINQIRQAKVEGVEPMAHAAPLVNVLRDDVPTPGLPLEKSLQNAPETDGPVFKVPKVIGGDEDSAG